MQAQWEFKTDPDRGGWYWICIEGGALSESVERFSSPAECIDDAEKHGYSEQSGT